MRTWITIGLWVLLILFPLAWLGSLSPAWEKFIDWLMAPEWLHVVTHAFIYAGLALLIIEKQRREGKTISIAALAGIVLVVGIVQEALQIASGTALVLHEGDLRGSAFDLMVDLAGGMLGLGIFSLLAGGRLRPREQSGGHDNGKD